MATGRHVLLVLTIVASVGIAGIAQSADGAFSNPTRFIPMEGEVLYRTSCQACHMPDGQGAEGAGRYPSLAKNNRLRPARYSIAIVLNGSRAMPPFGHQLDAAQVAAVVNYIRTHFGNEFDSAVSAADVQAFQRERP